MSILDFLEPKTESDKIKLIMSALNETRTIRELASIIQDSEPNTRRLISKIRKRHPIYTDSAGRGYKYANKEELMKLRKFEINTINNHKKNLEIINKCLGGEYAEDIQKKD